MKKEERKIIKTKIIRQLKRLESEIEELKELCKPIAPENAIGRVSRMDAINNKSVNEASLRMALKKQYQLNKSLKNIDSSSFGICTRCKKEIPIGRLMVMPESETCVSCN
ncbi:MAG: TraR/DksA C4-type zinc finger protein [Bacteroidota bacterium]|nr:TraR/DksA C4-type zinc finger protein [Bacteroidota bacterium]